MSAPRSAVAVALALLVTVVTWPALGLARAGAHEGLRSGVEPPLGQIHLELDRSEPMADSTVAPTDRVRLWFTQEPQQGTTQIRVMKGDNRVPMSDATVSEDDPASFLVTMDMPLSDGEYRVMWRAMAADGHVVDGEFGFTIAETGSTVR